MATSLAEAQEVQNREAEQTVQVIRRRVRQCSLRRCGAAAFGIDDQCVRYCSLIVRLNCYHFL